MRIVLDIETNSTHDKIWCVVTRNIDTDEWFYFTKPDTLQTYINNAEKIITHNGIFFDFPVLKKVWRITVKKSQVIDTLVLSRLYNPSLEDGHSLEAWGTRLGFAKMDYKQAWINNLTAEDNGSIHGTKYVPYKPNEWFDKPDMKLLVKYCVQDTLVTKQLYLHLEKEMKNDFSKKSIDLEHEVAIIIAEQERNGFKLDEKAAQILLCELKTKLDAIQVEMERIFLPSYVEFKGTPRNMENVVTYDQIPEEQRCRIVTVKNT